VLSLMETVAQQSRTVSHCLPFAPSRIGPPRRKAFGLIGIFVELQRPGIHPLQRRQTIGNLYTLPIGNVAPAHADAAPDSRAEWLES
jgi:hypothetical protein